MVGGRHWLHIGADKCSVADPQPPKVRAARDGVGQPRGASVGKADSPVAGAGGTRRQIDLEMVVLSQLIRVCAASPRLTVVRIKTIKKSGVNTFIVRSILRLRCTRLVLYLLYGSQVRLASLGLAWFVITLVRRAGPAQGAAPLAMPSAAVNPRRFSSGCSRNCSARSKKDRAKVWQGKSRLG